MSNKKQNQYLKHLCSFGAGKNIRLINNLYDRFNNYLMALKIRLMHNSILWKKFPLQFPSILQLVDFTLTIDSNFCQMNKQTFVLICELSEIEIELAKTNYNATVV